VIKSWSPSKLDKYESCPLKCKLETIDKLCPVCFKGKFRGGFEEPAVCRACGAVIPIPAPFERGTRINKELDAYVLGERKSIPKDGVNVTKWLKEFREAYRKKTLKLQVQITFTKNWKLTAWDDWDHGWLRVSLDVLYMPKPKAWQVIDWKTGKLSTWSTDKYRDQLALYSTAVMVAFPEVEEITSALVFVDAGKAVDLPEGYLTRKDVEKEQRRWEKRVGPMLTDTNFKPKPGKHCDWCDYSKDKGGPCPYSNVK
jgi:hypothetical protein